MIEAFALSVAWKATAILAAACLVNLLLWRASAAVRHSLWLLSLASLLLLPLCEAVLPAWRPAAALRVPAAIPEVRAAGPAGTLAIVRRTAPPIGRDALPFVLLTAWVAGALLFIRRWRAGIARVAQMRRDAEPLSGHGSIAHQAALGIGIQHPVPLFRSREEIVPLAAGVRNPAILLPASSVEWSRERLYVVLLHELAHIRRSDCLAQAIGELAACVYWFHPLVWLALRRLRLDRECACDDLVLHAGTKPSDYAAHLLALARSLQPVVSQAAVSMAAPRLETRLRAILNPTLSRRALHPAAGWAAALVAACLVLPLAAVRPQATDSKTVTGTVYDAAGARIPGATVIAVRTDGSQELKTTTDQEGKFTIEPLAGGTWQINIQARGFASQVVHVDRDHFDITLAIGQLQETVVVHGKGTAAAAPAGPQRVRVGGNVVPAKLLSKIDPEYPDDVRSRGVEGNVVLRAVISMTGTVLSLTSVSSPDPELTESAIKAVNQWRYQPSLLNGEPIETATTITVNFQLEP